MYLSNKAKVSGFFFKFSKLCLTSRQCKGQNSLVEEKSKGNAVTKLENHADGRESGEAVELASSGDFVAPKNGRLSITLTPHEQKQQVVAGVQPRLEQ
jgi:hypothetical protein